MTLFIVHLGLWIIGASLAMYLFYDAARESISIPEVELSPVSYAVTPHLSQQGR